MPEKMVNCCTITILLSKNGIMPDVVSLTLLLNKLSTAGSV